MATNGPISNNPLPGILPPHGPMPGPPTRPNTGQTPVTPVPPILPPLIPPIFPPLKTQTQPAHEPESPKVVAPIDDCMRSVTISGEDFCSIIDVYVNGVWRGTGTTGAAPSPPNLTASPTGPNTGLPLGPQIGNLEILLSGCCLKAGDLVQAAQTNVASGLTSPLSSGIRVESHVKYSWLTQHYDNARTGWFQYENQLNPLTTDWTNFGQKIQLPVDGKVYAQPLYMHHQYFPNMAQPAHNAVFLATENDTVYAYDANMLGEKINGVFQGVKLWQRSLLKDGQRALVAEDVSPDYSDISPTIGISSTPVIDCGCHNDCKCECGRGSDSKCGCNPTCRTATMYVVAKSIGKKDGVAHLFLHALDVTTGLDRPSSPVEIVASVRGTGGTQAEGGNDGKGNVIFIAKLHNQRPGLLLLNGRIYIGFGSHGDIDRTNYHGWVMSYDASTLEQKDVFCTTPDNGGQPIPLPNINDGDKSVYGAGSIWQAGMGLASDGQSIYFNTANGAFNIVTLDDIKMQITPNRSGRDFGNSVMKLSSNLLQQSFFTPANVKTIDAIDLDLGSGGVLLLPDPQAGISANLLVTCGKDGSIYLLDRNSLGGFGGYSYPLPTTFPANPWDDPNAISTLGLQMSNGTGIWFLGGPAFFKGTFGSFIFYAVDGDPIRAISVRNGTLAREGFTKEGFALGGTTPVVSSNVNDSASGIIWAIARIGTLGPGTLSLRAYQADALCSGSQNVNSLIPNAVSQIGGWNQGNALIEPTIVNGKVYAGCEDHVGVFF